MGEKGKVWTPPFSPWRGKARPIREQSSDTLCGSVRQEFGGAGAQVLLAAARALSEVPERWGLGKKNPLLSSGRRYDGL